MPPPQKREADRTFAVNLDALMAAEGAPSGREIAAAAGIGETDLSRIRNGGRVPSVAIGRRIADALGVSLDVLTEPLTERGRSRLDPSRALLRHLARPPAEDPPPPPTTPPTDLHS